MRFTRVLVGLLCASLLGLAPLALTASPAQAATKVYTGIALAKQHTKVHRYGNKIIVRGRAFAWRDGKKYALPNTGGKIVLKRRWKGSSKWRFVSSRSDESKTFTFRPKAKRNVFYRVTYTGGSKSGYRFKWTKRERYSRVARNSHAHGDKTRRGLFVRGNVDPGWGHRQVAVQKKNCGKCKWRGYKKVRTNRRGGFSAKIGAPRTGRWYWRVTLRPTKPRFVRGYSKVFYTYRR